MGALVHIKEIVSATNSFVEGLHKDVDPYVYHALDCASSHRLGLLKKSPAHLKYSIDNPTPSTDAMVLGEAIHQAVLERDRFYGRYVVAPDIDRRTTLGKQLWDIFQHENAGRIVLSKKDWAMCMAASESFNKHNIAKALLSELEDIELTGIWKDKETGLLCKMRVDGLARGLKNISDVKTTTDASRRSFERSIFNYGYHRQGAMYVDGMRALGEDVDHFTIIAFEKAPPFEVAVYRLEDDILELGRKENQKLLRLYAHCVEKNDWPGYGEEVQEVGIPAWAYNQITEDLYE